MEFSLWRSGLSMDVDFVWILLGCFLCNTHHSNWKKKLKYDLQDALQHAFQSYLLLVCFKI